ncbi:MAG TPA: hypothetical protein VKB57_06150, partial [Acidimicrobiales bacterium]|nr:hypothetical protein [Acidimicrobiales bacterium]
PLRFRIGQPPDTASLRRDVIERPAGTPYLERFHLVISPQVNIRFHHFCADDPADLHDHPWDSTSLLLYGRVREHTAHRADRWEPGDIVTRPAEQAHRLELLDGEAWTYFVTGPLLRRWGFHVGARWIPWQDYPGAGTYGTGAVGALTDRSGAWAGED